MLSTASDSTIPDRSATTGEVRIAPQAPQCCRRLPTLRSRTAPLPPGKSAFSLRSNTARAKSPSVLDRSATTGEVRIAPQAPQCCRRLPTLRSRTAPLPPGKSVFSLRSNTARAKSPSVLDRFATPGFATPGKSAAQTAFFGMNAGRDRRRRDPRQVEAPRRRYRTTRGTRRKGGLLG